MDTVTRLRVAVGLLTRPSKHRLVDEIGEARWVTADPLLSQLHVAIHNSSNSGQGKSGGTPIPLSADAFDLARKIDLTTWSYWRLTYPLHKGQGAEAMAPRLRAWSMAAESHEGLLMISERICSGWVNSIQTLLQPVRRLEIQGSCPTCGVGRILDHYDEEGGKVMKPALSIEYQDGVPGDAVCGNCGQTWGGTFLSDLGRHVNGAGL